MPPEEGHFGTEFSADANSLVDEHDERIEWTNLVVRESDLLKFLGDLEPSGPGTGPQINSNYWLDRKVAERQQANRLAIREAARIAYEAIEQLPIVEMVTLGCNGDPEEILDSMIRWILETQPLVDLEGMTRPSTVARKLDLTKRYLPVRGTSKLAIHGESVNAAVEDVTIARADLNKVVERIRRLDKEMFE